MEAKYIVLIICFVILGGFLAWLSVKSQHENLAGESKEFKKLSIRQKLKEVRSLQN
jgi:hypothetical protein